MSKENQHLLKIAKTYDGQHINESIYNKANFYSFDVVKKDLITKKWMVIQ